MLTSNNRKFERHTINYFDILIFFDKMIVFRPLLIIRIEIMDILLIDNVFALFFYYL